MSDRTTKRLPDDTPARRARTMAAGLIHAANRLEDPALTRAEEDHYLDLVERVAKAFSGHDRDHAASMYLLDAAQAGATGKHFRDRRDAPANPWPSGTWLAMLLPMYASSFPDLVQPTPEQARSLFDAWRTDSAARWKTVRDTMKALGLGTRTPAAWKKRWERHVDEITAHDAARDDWAPPARQ